MAFAYFRCACLFEDVCRRTLYDMIFSQRWDYDPF